MLTHTRAYDCACSQENTQVGFADDGKAYAQPQDDIALRLEALKVCNGVWDSPHVLSHKHQDVKLSLVRKLGR